jgi:hypothetical protein
MGLSIAAMGAAALGYLPPLAGAVLQEAIDVAVILNALRALHVHGPREVERRSRRSSSALSKKSTTSSALSWSGFGPPLID